MRPFTAIKPALRRAPLPFTGMLASALAMLACNGSAPGLDNVDNPAVAGSMAPSLTRGGPDRTIVMSWLEKGDGGHRLRFAGFDGRAFGEPGTVAAGDDWFANWADTPGIRVRADGTWLAHWLAKSAESTYAYDVRLARSADRGASWTRLETPHRDGTPTEHGFVSYFSLDNGETGIVWLDGRETIDTGTGAMTLRSATVDVGGTVGPARVLDDAVCDCCKTASATTALGPVVVYRDRSADEIRDISIMRNTADGWTRPVRIHADGWKIGGCPVNGPAMIARGTRVIVAWFTMADDVPRVRFAISDDAGASFGEPNTRSPGSALGRVQLAWTRDGFVLAWMEETGGSARMRLAQYAPDGTLEHDRVLTQLDQGRISGFPQIAVLGNRLLLAWTAPAENATRIKTALTTLP